MFARAPTQRPTLAPITTSADALRHRALGDSTSALTSSAWLAFDNKATSTPWIDISDKPSASSCSPADPKPFGFVHIEQTPYGSATSTNSLGLSVTDLPAFEDLPSPEQSQPTDNNSIMASPIDLPGAFDPADPSSALFGSLTNSLLGLQFDEDLDTFADPTFRSESPPLVPVTVPRPVGQDMHMQRPVYARKRVASYFLPTPPSEDEDEQPPKAEVLSQRRTSNPILGIKQSPIPLPSVPGSPLRHCLALPSHDVAARATNSAVGTRDRSRSASLSMRLEPTPPPPSSPTLVPSTTSIWNPAFSMGSTQSARPRQLDARHLSEALLDVSPRGGRRPSIPLPELGHAPVSPKRRRLTLSSLDR
ncbi:hypothetical protein OIO90_003174 [Microbotryomycetes sp. JL221]|nr:hypothetical protein OIO90_003174 [Microbotryomycetes sp. JL221]